MAGVQLTNQPCEIIVSLALHHCNDVWVSHIEAPKASSEVVEAVRQLRVPGAHVHAQKWHDNHCAIELGAKMLPRTYRT